MEFIEQWKKFFSVGDRSRGKAYFEEGMVERLRLDAEGWLTSRVQGSFGHYDVKIELGRDGGTSAMCSCPRFSDGFNCKHIWATLLEFEENASKIELASVGASRAEQSAKGAKKSQGKKKQKSLLPKPAAWEALLDGKLAVPPDRVDSKEAESKTELIFVLDVGGMNNCSSQFDVRVLRRKQKPDGSWGQLRILDTISPNGFADKLDEEIVQALASGESFDEWDDEWSHWRDDFRGPSRDLILSDLILLRGDENAIASLVDSGRFYWTLDDDYSMDSMHKIESADLANHYSVRAEIVEMKKPKGADELTFHIVDADNQRLDESSIVMFSGDGLGLLTTGLIRVGNFNSLALWRDAQAAPKIRIKKAERADFLDRFAKSQAATPIGLPEKWNVKTASSEPAGRLELREAKWTHELDVAVQFTYGSRDFSVSDHRTAIFDKENNSWVTRDLSKESQLYQALEDSPYLRRGGRHQYVLRPRDLMNLVDSLGAEGWEIVLKGTPIRHSGEFDIAVESGQDWFDLSVDVKFDGESIPLPSLLAALANNEKFVRLADGGKGRIPQELVEKYAKIAEFGETHDDKIRFRSTQAMLLDAMLSSQPGVRVDKKFKSVCAKLNSFKGIKARKPVRTFNGELRSYQQDGLGWLSFLRDFGLGGCLADDMGLGKTVQVLAMLESRRTRRTTADKSPKPAAKGSKAAANGKSSSSKKAAAKSKKNVNSLVKVAEQEKRKPSIVVAPKSLVFNWIDEATRFAPRLRVLNYTGTDRKARAEESAGFDILITTYHTMAKDIADLAELDFDYAILDESQAIKNAKTNIAKASRLLQSDHRLAMTGTPIENHLGELWSLFEFLNPGMLGSSRKFANLTRPKKRDEVSRQEMLQSLSKALQPFILRRTKTQVLTDLPPKTEQTLYCEMAGAQKKKYEELKEYYRVKLKKKVATDGIGKSKIQVLEALLRLRQVACDPRLLDDKQKPGAKLDLLRQQIAEVTEQGHKVLIFSQFTTLLSLVREQFDKDKVRYEYLDGKTSNRKEPVKRFQSDPEISAFLISLKAGGHGLNLTAADYVFLLDPWWNPAVEAQAVDRAHRMGQQRPVIAYRMICRDTVEEKIVELQESKRELADSIIRADESLIRSLTAEDVALLFQ